MKKPTQDDFSLCIESPLKETQHLLLKKGKEYVRGNDRFHNFHRTAEMNRITPTKALHGMLSKHITSYLDMLDDIEKGIMPSEGTVNEKLGDIIVYFHLQEALIKKTIKTK